MLCLVEHDPWDKALHRFLWDNSALPAVTPDDKPAPFAVLLDDGTWCKYFYKALGARDDGYYGLYRCGPLDALLAKAFVIMSCGRYSGGLGRNIPTIAF